MLYNFSKVRVERDISSRDVSNPKCRNFELALKSDRQLAEWSLRVISLQIDNLESGHFVMALLPLQAI